MAFDIKTKKLMISGMTCPACQNKIERKLRNTAGVITVKVSYRDGTADITYDSGKVSEGEITCLIEKLDYKILSGSAAQKPGVGRAVLFLAAVAALFALLQYLDILALLVPNQLAETNMSYGLLFVIGLLTSIHCIAMCGGINLSQCLSRRETPAGQKYNHIDTFIPALLYNLGRVISYTTIGFVLGFIGMLLGGGAQMGLPVMAQGVLKILAGLLMVVMGINMLGLFPFLRKLNPRLPKDLSRLIGEEKLKNKSPLIVGLLNGLMPCGPLQSMQIVALASCNPLAGGFAMLMFSLGTVPLMLGLGSVMSALGKRFTAKVMTVGAVLVVVLGLAMLSQGWQLWRVSGVTFTSNNTNTQNANTQNAEQPQNADDVQIINSTLSSRGYPNITVKKGTSVRWVIDAPKGSINGCNGKMYIGEYNIEHEFTVGENVIEFTPTKAGKFQYTCWMGMIRATITVTE